MVSESWEKELRNIDSLCSKSLEELNRDPTKAINNFKETAYPEIRSKFVNLFKYFITQGKYAIADESSYKIFDYSLQNYAKLVSLLSSNLEEAIEESTTSSELHPELLASTDSATETLDPSQNSITPILNITSSDEEQKRFKKFYQESNFYKSIVLDLRHLTVSVQKSDDQLIVRIREIDFEVAELININDFKILKLLLELEYLDVSLPTSKDPEEIIHKIARIFFNLKGSKGDSVVSNAILKSVFLLKKAWVQHPSLKLSIVESDISENISEYPLPSPLNGLIRVSKLNNKDKLTQLNITELGNLSKNIQNNSLRKFIKIKIIKDSSKTTLVEYFDSLLKLKEIADEFDVKTINSNQNFDSVSMILNKTYTLNNLMSLANELIESKVIAFTLVDLMKLDKMVGEAFTEISQFNVKSNQTENYFSYYKYCLFISSKLTFLIENAPNQSQMKHELQSTMIKTLKPNLKKLIEIFHLFKKFQKFQFSFKNSLYLNKELFIYSNINSTQDIYREEDRIRELQYATTLLETKIEQIDQIEKNAQGLQIQAEVIKQELSKVQEDSVRKTTEILSIFAAIVVFSLGSLQLFQSFKDLYDALWIMALFCLATITIYTSIHLMNKTADPKGTIPKCIVGVFLLAFAFIFGIQFKKNQTKELLSSQILQPEPTPKSSPESPNKALTTPPSSSIKSGARHKN